MHGQSSWGVCMAGAPEPPNFETQLDMDYDEFHGYGGFHVASHVLVCALSHDSATPYLCLSVTPYAHEPMQHQAPATVIMDNDDDKCAKSKFSI